MLIVYSNNFKIIRIGKSMKLLFFQTSNSRAHTHVKIQVDTFLFLKPDRQYDVNFFKVLCQYRRKRFRFTIHS